MSLNLVEKHLWMMICKQRGWMLGQDSTIQGLEAKMESRLAGSAIQCCSRVGSQDGWVEDGVLPKSWRL